MRSRWTFPAVSAGKVSQLVTIGLSVCPSVFHLDLSDGSVSKQRPNNVQTKGTFKKKTACVSDFAWLETLGMPFRVSPPPPPARRKTGVRHIISPAFPLILPGRALSFAALLSSGRKSRGEDEFPSDYHKNGERWGETAIKQGEKSAKIRL